MGGMTEAISAGLPKRRIEECAVRQQAHIDAGVQVIVGVNRYGSQDDAQQGQVAVRQIDNSAVLARQTARLDKLRAARDEARVSAGPTHPAAAGRAAAVGAGPPGWTRLLHSAVEV